LFSDTIKALKRRGVIPSKVATSMRELCPGGDTPFVAEVTPTASGVNPSDEYGNLFTMYALANAVPGIMPEGRKSPTFIFKKYG
jgi:hypothetical protein